MEALEKTKWTELNTLFDACHKQDSYIEPNSTLSLKERARRGEKVEIPDQHLVCAVEMCGTFFGHVLAKGYELIGEGADARDVMILLVEMICEEVDCPRLPPEGNDKLLKNIFGKGVYEFQIPATFGGAPSTISESFKILSICYPGGVGIQRAFDQWIVKPELPFNMRRTFKKLPQILLVACDESSATNPPRKPLTRADVDSFTLTQRDGEEFKYELIGLAVHREQHWISVFPDKHDSWFCYDDESISPMEVVDDAALICYERVN